jgi:hypothetical protein
MMRLLEVEMRRDLARRLVRMLILVALVGIGLIGVLIFVNTDSYSSDDIALDEQQRASQLQQCVDYSVEVQRLSAEEARQYCRDSQAGGDDSGSEIPYLTDLWTGDSADGGGELSIAVIFLLMGGLIGGATVIGAEWRHGTFATQLTWEPRRLRLLGTKLAAAVVLAILIALLLEALYVLALLPTAALKGSTAGADGRWWAELFLAMLRGSVLTAGAVLIGASVASIGRNTGAALGIVLGWVAVCEPILRQVRPKWEPYMLTASLGAILPWDSFELRGLTLSPERGAMTLAAYIVALVLLALVLMQKRDIGGAS